VETRDGKKYQEYAKLRNQVKNSVKKVKMSMERDIARDVKKNPKKFWKYANSKRKNNATALWWPSWRESATAGHHFARGSSNDYSIKVWF
jgi:hypothetical protein